MAGGDHSQLWPQRGEFSSNLGGDTMVHFRGIRANKQHVRPAFHGSGTETGAKQIIDDPDGGPECASGRPI